MTNKFITTSKAEKALIKTKTQLKWTSAKYNSYCDIKCIASIKKNF